MTFSLTLKMQNHCCTPFITTTTLCSRLALTKTCRPPRLLCKTDHLKRLISLPDTNEPSTESSMNSKITSSFGRRILIHANHLIGGGGDVLNFQIYIVLLETSFPFLVSLFILFLPYIEANLTLYLL